MVGNHGVPNKSGAVEMNIGVVAGDGIGPEVVQQALLRLLNCVRPDITVTEYDFGATRYLRTGELLSDNAIRELKQHDALLLGAIGDPSVPPGVLERGLLLKLRFALDHHVNLRPAVATDIASRPTAGTRTTDQTGAAVADLVGAT